MSLARKSLHIIQKMTGINRKEGKNMIVPSIIEKTSNGERTWDPFSRLLKERIIWVSGEVGSEMADLVIAEMLLLDSESHDDITMYIDSPGGSVTAGLAIIDTMNLIKSDVRTISVGLSASMGAMILTCGTPGKRCSLKNSNIMIHQPLISGGIGGQASDIAIHAENIMKTREKLEKMISETTGKSIDEVHSACDRDNHMDAEEALAFGLIDEIL